MRRGVGSHWPDLSQHRKAQAAFVLLYLVVVMAIAMAKELNMASVMVKAMAIALAMHCYSYVKQDNERCSYACNYLHIFTYANLHILPYMSCC